MSEAHGSCTHHTECPKCGSQDNVAVYEDGYEKCFGMGCGYYKMPDGAEPAAPKPKKKSAAKLIQDWETSALPKRGLYEETCEKWKYGIGTYNGRTVQVANYVKDGQVVAQKVRDADKNFVFLGDGKECGLYGQHLFRPGGKKLCIVEGELDALSVSQLFKLKWPVVSLPKGAAGAARSIKQELEYVLSFDEVVLMFDNDDAGQQATDEVAALLPPGKCKIATLPLKDANAMLVANRGPELIEAFWSARTYRPDGIVSIGELKEQALKPVKMGTPWPWKGLTAATKGRRDGELIGLGAGTGIGKTDVVTQVIEHDAVQLNIKCGVIYLEQPPVETVWRIAGKLAGKKFHLPNRDVDPETGEDWTVQELSDAIDTLDATKNIELYNHFGSMDWPTVEAKIRYMVTSLECKHIFLDHLTALAAHADDERKELESILADMASLAQELKFVFHYISHLATPEGKPHEEGGRVFLRHFKGSRAIGYWSHFAIGLERDQQAEDLDDRLTTTLRVLKDRYTGAATGFTTGLRYDLSTGLLSEVSLKKKESKSGFKDETIQDDF